MKFIVALRLLGFFIGAVLQFVLWVLVKRYRQIQKLEILFLGLTSCLLTWNLCNFLTLIIENTQGATQMTQSLLKLGPVPVAFCALWFVPSALLHTHLALARVFFQWRLNLLFRLAEALVYIPLLSMPAQLLELIDSYPSGSQYSRSFASWFALALLASAFLEMLMLRRSGKREERNLFRVLILVFTVTALLTLYVCWIGEDQWEWGPVFETLLMVWSISSCAILSYTVFRYQLLDIVIHRSIGYMFAVVLFLMVYLVGVGWVRDSLYSMIGFPGTVVDAGMILALFAFFQPVRRWIDSSVDSIFSVEISKVQNLAARLDDASRTTVEVEKLLRLIEDLLQKELGLKEIKILLSSTGEEPQALTGSQFVSNGKNSRIRLTKGKDILGEILVPQGLERLSNQQRAGLQFLVTQIVAAIENCRLSEGKILLERELAERDKMATLGQMAASVAHNIKNPLSSIKTIVQLMQEDQEVGRRCERDLTLINSEIDRLTNSVTQLLKFSRPWQTAMTQVGLQPVVEKVVQVFQPEAERRGIHLSLDQESAPLLIRGSAEILTEVVENLVLNAIEVSPPQSRIEVRTRAQTGEHQRIAAIHVEDEGPGISPEVRPHIFKPFFTTKQKGTGLGLAVVHRRVLDMGGQVMLVSPVAGNRGTRFELVFPVVT